MLEHYYRSGFNPMLLQAGGKKPLDAWKEQQEKRPSLEELQRKWRPELNIAIVCGELRETGANILGLDFDSEAVFQEVYPKLPESPMVAKTSRGYHAYYRLPLGERVPNRVHVGGKEIDFRNQGGYMVAPPSFNQETGVRYEWIRGPVDAKDLPIFPMELLPKEEERTTVPLNLAAEVSRAKRYLERAGGAISGQGGHRKTFRLACRLVHPPEIGFGLSFEDALSLLLWWNQFCKPEWTQKELEHKVQDAFKNYPKG